MTDVSRRVAEASREKQWQGGSFLRELFLGRLRLDLIPEVPVGEPDRPEFARFLSALRALLAEHADPVEIDRTGEYPQPLVEGLARLGAFGLKIPAEYGGLGLTHAEYVRVMQLLGSYDGNVTALLSAHQAIGVPQPLMLFGSEALKCEYLPRCARGEISAFALTERAVGSDPARLETVARRSEDGEHWILDGEKLWTTNGTIAGLLVVMARDPATDRINCFVVETGWEGVVVEHRCRFMGLRALANGQIGFDGVKVPRRNLVGEEGHGLRIALVTLNTGRLSLPAATAGTVERCLQIARTWSRARHQWGGPIGRHEAIAHKLSDLATSAYAMESVAHLLGTLADDGRFDIRLEAAAAKEWNTVRGWTCIDETLQVCGGRGYETESSLAGRGEVPIPVERLMRDSRINMIFEGSSEIMHLFIAREALDKHLDVAGALVDPDADARARLAALPSVLGFYGWWYPTRWVGWGAWPRYADWGRLATHVRWADRTARRLARSLFHAMVVWRAGLEKKQGVLFRHVDVALEVFAVVAGLARARATRERGLEQAERATDLADAAARDARRRVSALFSAIRSNDDARRYRTGRAALEGDYAWLEGGTMGPAFDVESLRPPTVGEILRRRREGARAGAAPGGSAGVRR